MSYVKLKIQSGQPFTGVIELEHLDDEEDVVERKLGKGLFLGDVIKIISKGQLSLGELEIILDFDENGSLLSLEFYT